MKNATDRCWRRKAIGLFMLALFSPAIAMAFGPGVPRRNTTDPASLAVVGGSLLGFGLYRRKNP